MSEHVSQASEHVSNMSGLVSHTTAAAVIILAISTTILWTENKDIRQELLRVRRQQKSFLDQKYRGQHLRDLIVPGRLIVIDDGSVPIACGHIPLTDDKSPTWKPVEK